MNSALKCFARVQLLGLSYYCQVHRALILFPFFGSSEVCLCSLGHQPASSPTPPAQERNPAKPTTVGRIQEVQEGSDGLSCVLMLEADCRHEWLLLPQVMLCKRMFPAFPPLPVLVDQVKDNIHYLTCLSVIFLPLIARKGPRSPCTPPAFTHLGRSQDNVSECCYLQHLKY